MSVRSYTMKTTGILLTTCALLAYGLTPAAGGPCSDQIAQLTKMMASKDAGSGPTTGTSAPVAADQKGQHPGTSLMSKEAEGKAASPADVRRQSGMMGDASAALAYARVLDRQGKEAECMNTVRNAKELGGL
jgi:hypothetical protein